MTKSPRPNPLLYSPEREKRVADALRENLRKRKLQQRKKSANDKDEK